MTTHTLNNCGWVMPVHNAPEYVDRSLSYILDNYSKKYLTPGIVVDDCSDELTKRVISDVTTKIRFPLGKVYKVSLDKQQLFTRAVNFGIRSLLHEKPNLDYIFIVNSDCDLKEGCFEKLIEAMESDPTIGVAGYTDSPQHSENFLTYVENPGYVTGHMFCVKREVFEKVGVFCETDLGGPTTTYPEFAAYKGLAHIGSDRLFSNDARKAGFKTVYVNYPGVEHEAGKSWRHDLGWLANFNLELLWEPCNTLKPGTY
jgi:GT2 family glycosyltransferase